MNFHITKLSPILNESITQLMKRVISFTLLGKSKNTISTDTGLLNY